ncbi:MAG TPA: hypothetical protein VEG63_10105 [Candidatus Acidoferrales bacterium]|nr:hypothetical protein [Candidatus Acidoferrales bacterium]
MASTEPASGGYRTAVRWGLLFAGLITVGMRVPELHQFWFQWHALGEVDAAAAGSYRRYFLGESGITLFVLAMAAGLFWMLGPRRKKAE